MVRPRVKSRVFRLFLRKNRVDILRKRLDCIGLEVNMETIYKPESVYFSKLGGDTVIVILMIENGKALFEPAWQTVGQDEVLTLDEIRQQVQKQYEMCGIILVMTESYLEGVIYRYGNYGDFWVEIGNMSGYA